MAAKNPEVTATLRPDENRVGLAPERLLFVGQKRPAGTATSGELQNNIGTSSSEWEGLFGVDSPLTAAIDAARRLNKNTVFAAIGVDDDGGASSATGEFTITGTATESGEFVFYVASQKFKEYKIAVADTDTSTIIGDALVAAITADTKSLVTASNAAGVVTLTAKNKGTFGNTIGLKTTGAVSGVGVAITAAMTGGAGDPVLTGVLDVLGKERYQGIVWQFEQDLDEVKDFLDARFNVFNDVLDGIAFVSITDTFVNQLATLAPLNSQSLSINVDNKIARDDHQGPANLELPFVKAAMFASIRALRRTDGSILNRFVITRSQRDGRGGIWMNSKPYFNTPLPDLELPGLNDTFDDQGANSEIIQLRNAGGWTIDRNRAGTAVIVDQVVTTYKTDAAGNEDITFGFLEYVDTSTAAREYFVVNTRAKYPQYRLTGGQLLQRNDSANEASIRAYAAELNADLADFALVNNGTGTVDGVDVDYKTLFRQNLKVSTDLAEGKSDISAKLYIITQLRAIDYDLAISFRSE